LKILIAKSNPPSGGFFVSGFIRILFACPAPPRVVHFGRELLPTAEPLQRRKP
jgi:hypothetical protein